VLRVVSRKPAPTQGLGNLKANLVEEQKRFFNQEQKKIDN
jgi:hypothetical protein